MKKLIALISVLALTVPAFAQVKPHRSSGKKESTPQLQWRLERRVVRESATNVDMLKFKVEVYAAFEIITEKDQCAANDVACIMPQVKGLVEKVLQTAVSYREEAKEMAKVLNEPRDVDGTQFILSQFLQANYQEIAKWDVEQAGGDVNDVVAVNNRENFYTEAGEQLAELSR